MTPKVTCFDTQEDAIRGQKGHFWGHFPVTLGETPKVTFESLLSFGGSGVLEGFQDYNACTWGTHGCCVTSGGLSPKRPCPFVHCRVLWSFDTEHDRAKVHRVQWKRSPAPAWKSKKVLLLPDLSFGKNANKIQEWPRQTKPKKGQFMNFSQGHSGTKVQCESC